jgi:hypothetical protein
MELRPIRYYLAVADEKNLVSGRRAISGYAAFSTC